jgi:serine/threonine protein phosphatase PrpC
MYLSLCTPKRILVPPILIYAMLSHPGRVRQNNEDFCAASSESGAFVVCDGMGGAAAGEVASHLAAETFVENLAPADLTVRPEIRLAAAVRAANQAVFHRSRTSPELHGMGTTLVGILHSPPPKTEPTSEPAAEQTPSTPVPDLWIANVGDSRCYLFRARKIAQLTSDHSLVEEQVRAGQITAAQAARSPMRNFITRAIGSLSTVEPDIQSLTTRPGDILLLASDGLTRELSDSDIATVLSDIPSPPTEPYLSAACQYLINAANHNGGRDNVTVLLIAFPQGIDRRKPRRHT